MCLCLNTLQINGKNHSRIIPRVHEGVDTIIMFQCWFTVCDAGPALKPFQAWIYHCHLPPLQAANCCRNSRLVVEEDDLIGGEKKMPCIRKPVSWNSKTLSCRKIRSVLRDVKWCFDASRGLKGLKNIRRTSRVCWLNTGFCSGSVCSLATWTQAAEQLMR